MIPVIRPPVVMRCNASPSVGLGHLMRCRELARLLTNAGHLCAIIGPPDSLRQPADAGLFAQWHAVDDRGTSQDDAARVLYLCAGMGARHLVMDDYRIDPAYQLILKHAGLRWLQQFDASAPWDFHADVLVNAGPAERREDYLKYLKNPKIETLFGPAYAVLHPDFAGLFPRPDGRPITRILVSFGGGDDRGAIDLALAALVGVPHVTPVIVSGTSNPRNAALAAQIPDRAELHIAPTSIAALMADCDMALIAGGTMSYEAAICGLPMVLIPLAPNQIRSCQGWADRAGAVVLSGLDTLTPALLRTAVLALMDDQSRRQAMATTGRALVDGKGAQRLLEALLQPDSRRAWDVR
jgi:UDP-2,4-diacetamido-2,4,6-trideoxy-beta-L-altropyranose hydrolase